MEEERTSARKCPDVNAINLLRTLHFNIHPGDVLPDLLPFLPAFSLPSSRFFLVLVFPSVLYVYDPSSNPALFSSVAREFPQLLCAYLPWRDASPKLGIITVYRESRSQ